MPNLVLTYKLLKYDVDYQLEKLGKLALWLEDNFLQQGSQAVAEDTSGVPKELVPIYNKHASDMLSTLPRIARNSLFTNVYSFIEYELIRLCTDVFESSFQIKLKNLNGRGIEQTKLYLSKVVNLPLPEFFDNDRDYGLLNIVRNSIVHNYGIVLENKRNKLSTLRKHLNDYAAEFDVDSAHKITLKKGFVPTVLDNGILMFAMLFGDIDELLLPEA